VRVCSGAWLRPREQKQELFRLVGARVGGIKACYVESLRSDPDLRARIVVRAEVQRDGSLAAVEAVVRRSSGSPQIADCLVREVATWSTELRPEVPLVVELPFRFSPAR
jgi:hypothetical protein